MPVFNLFMLPLPSITDFKSGAKHHVGEGFLDHLMAKGRHPVTLNAALAGDLSDSYLSQGKISLKERREKALLNCFRKKPELLFNLIEAGALKPKKGWLANPWVALLAQLQAGEPLEPSSLKTMGFYVDRTCPNVKEFFVGRCSSSRHPLFKGLGLLIHNIIANKDRKSGQQLYSAVRKNSFACVPRAKPVQQIAQMVSKRLLQQFI